MKTGEVLSLIGLIFSSILFVTTLIVFFKNSGKDKMDKGERTAKIEGKIDFIKIQTELINAQNKEIANKIDSQNGRLIIVEQTIATAHIVDVPLQITRLDENLKSAHKRINEIGSEIKIIKQSLGEK